MALFWAFCAATDLDPGALSRQACRPDWDRGRADCDQISAATEWQGVRYPDRWGPYEMRGLLRSLHAVNKHALAFLLEETLPYLVCRREIESLRGD